MNSKRLPAPPCHAVVFSSHRTGGDDGYAQAAARMEALAATMPGYLGIESARDEDGFGITVSYWESEEAIRHWKANAEHLAVRKRGREAWYKDFIMRVAKVERAYWMTKKQ